MIRFRTQVTLVTTGLVLATSLALGALLISVSTRMMYRQMDATGRAFTRLLATQLDQKREMLDRFTGPRQPPPQRALPSAQPRPERPGGAPGRGFDADLLELASIARASRIAVVAGDKVLVDLKPTGAPTSGELDKSLPEIWRELRDPSSKRVGVYQTRSFVIFSAALSARDPNSDRPGLLVEFPKTLPRQVIEARAVSLGLTAFAVVGAAVAAAWVVSRGISKPLSRLAATAKSFGEGALDQPAPVAGPTETRHLGLALNAMASSLKAHIQSLREETGRREQLESELRVAADLQRSLLPQPGLQTFGSVEIFGWSEAAKAVGGDFYDFRSVGPDKLLAVIGDATGHGLTAALLAAKCVSVIQALAEEYSEPGELLCRANTLISEQFRGDGHFVTAFLAIVDYTNGSLCYSRAGHNPPLLMNGQNDGPVALSDQQGLPLAVVHDSLFESTTITIAAGDTLLLYTDGITEAPDAENRLYGQAHLSNAFAECCRSPLPALVETLIGDVNSYCNNQPADDDRTFLCLRIG